MAIQFIEIGSKNTLRRPIVKLTEATPGSIWQYMGTCVGAAAGNSNSRRLHDLNCAAEAAAAALADKVADRNITVELQIDPMIPPLLIEMERIVPILTLIAENASASVEPGPGTVVLQTWCTDKFAGMDAIGQHGHVPIAVRESWMLPGFSTRVAEWDTGFGLHDAVRAADAIDAKIELLDQTEAVALRLAIPLAAETPLPSAENQVGIPSQEKPEPGYVLIENDPLRFTVHGILEGLEDVRTDGIVQA